MADGWPVQPVPEVDNACVSWDSSLLRSAPTFAPIQGDAAELHLSKDVTVQHELRKCKTEAQLYNWICEGQAQQESTTTSPLISISSGLLQSH